MISFFRMKSSSKKSSSKTLKRRQRNRQILFASTSGVKSPSKNIPCLTDQSMASIPNSHFPSPSVPTPTKVDKTTSTRRKKPYSLDFILQYCQRHWSGWVAQVKEALDHTHDVLMEGPSRQLASAARGLRKLQRSMLEV